LCNHDIATNFGVVVKEVILIDSCVVIVIYFVKKIKIKPKKNWKKSCGTVQNEIVGGIRL